MNNKSANSILCSNKKDFSNKLKGVCNSGRSMLEMIGVLAIIGILSVGGISGYSKAMEKI